VVFVSDYQAGDPTRKLSRESKASVGVILPITLIRQLGWKTKQKVTVRKWGKGLIIRDWRKQK
jgi:hypothetical protein